MRVKVASALRVAEAAEPARRACPGCGVSDPIRLDKFSTPEWSVEQCGDCDFVYLSNPPDYSALVEEYAWEKTFAAEKVRRKTKHPIMTWLDTKTRWRLHVLRPDQNKEFRAMFGSGRVLDVGCGAGLAVPEPLIPYGVEISAGQHKRADEYMRSRGGYAVHAPAVEGVGMFPEGFFAGVVLRSFLEHEVQPALLLRQVRRAIAPGGVVYVKVPNYGGLNRWVMGPKWCGFRYPDHVNYFTLKSLTRMVEECGFTLTLRNPFNLLLDDNIHAELRAR